MTVNPTCAWQQVGASYDGAALKVYYNGRVDGSVSVSGALFQPPSGPLSVGADCSCGSASCLTAGFNGLVDDVKVSGRVAPALPARPSP